MDVKNQINNELQNMILPQNFKQQILQKSKKKKNKWKYQVAAIFLCLILGATSVYAGYVIYNKINVNEETIPQLQPMEKKETGELIAIPNEIGDYTKMYSTYSELCSDLGLNILRSDLAEDNQYMIISRKTDNQNWEEIRVTAYIVGDVSKIEKVDGENFYSWEAGEEYDSPIDMTIEIICSDEQLEIGWEKDYLGAFEFEETYQSGSGYTVNILRDNAVEEKDTHTGYKTKCCAIFVADGIRYTLSGQVEIEKMKEIVNSMHY